MKNQIASVFLVALLAAGCARKEEIQDPAESVRSAWNDYRLGEFRRSVTTFDAAIASTPEDDENHLQALYGLATCWNLRLPAADQDKERAAQLYGKVLQLAPRHDLAAWSLLGLARMKHLVPVGEEPDYAAVRAAYQKVVDQFPGHLAAQEAFLYFNATLVATLKTKECQESAAALEKYVAQDDAAFRSAAHSLLTVAYAAMDMQPQRLVAEIKSLETLEVDPSNPFNELSGRYWNIATIAEFELGDFATARKYYQKLLDEYPTDVKKYSVKVALKRMDDLETKLRAERGGAS
jgi:tetratricopeptide (TPR) repeat protein